MPREPSLFETIADLERRSVRFALVTVVATKGSTPRKAGAKMVVCADGTTPVTVGTVGGGRFEHEMIAEARAAIEVGEPRLVKRHLTQELAMCCGGEMDVFIEPALPRETLVLVGGGHVNAALAVFGARLGFEVVVVDDLETLANRARFPDASRFVSSWDPREWGIPLDASAYIVIASREHSVDQDVLTRLGKHGATPGYVGVISSQRKITRFRKQLEARGVEARWIEQVRGPIGIPIPAETPEEIAVAVAAELVAVRHGRGELSP